MLGTAARTCIRRIGNERDAGGGEVLRLSSHSSSPPQCSTSFWGLSVPCLKVTPFSWRIAPCWVSKFPFIRPFHYWWIICSLFRQDDPGSQLLYRSLFISSHWFHFILARQPHYSEPLCAPARPSHGWSQSSSFLCMLPPGQAHRWACQVILDPVKLAVYINHHK